MPRSFGVLPGAGQSVLLLTTSLFVAPEPPREARRGTIVRPDYGGYCCVLCVLPPLTRCGGETSQQRQGTHRAEEMGGETSQQRQGTHRAEEMGDLYYSPSGSPDPWAATVKIGSSTWAEGRVLGVITQLLGTDQAQVIALVGWFHSFLRSRVHPPSR
ncbi:hypothetical protein Taro_051686 [Colocasia esculenta]|uniref:Uncharacterized protein n=1 Tax=Colocasia esculenta TaxID=4460 RepID=A0A843XHK4_COLES|nr:hypothetical protein [Colocasia esculenta]